MLQLNLLLLADGKANFIILLFILKNVIVTGVNVTRPDVVGPFYL